MKDSEKFSEEWWKKFIDDNDNFTKTRVVKNVLNSEMLNTLNQEIVNALISRFQRKDRSGFRLYFPDEGKGIVNKQFLDELYDTPPNHEEKITDYCNRVFNKPFGLIVNSVEKHNESLAIKLRKLVCPLLEIRGMPVCGMHITVFIGNYGWTPLGIHQDNKGANVIHFHLGPGNKTMYTWDRNKYDKLTGTKHNNHEIEPLLPEANKYEFGTGDLFFMPWDKFHIGHSDELSVGLTFWFVDPTKTIFLDSIINTFLTQYVSKEEEDVISPEKDYLYDDKSFDDLLSILKLEENILKMPLKDFFYKIYKEYKYSIYSNEGWESSTLTKKDLEQYDVDEYEYLLSETIKLRSPFNILFIQDPTNDILQFYVRGVKLEMRYDDSLVRIIEELNTFDPYTVKELLKHLNPDWPIEAGLYFISMLYDSNCLELISEEKENVSTLS